MSNNPKLIIIIYVITSIKKYKNVYYYNQTFTNYFSPYALYLCIVSLYPHKINEIDDFPNYKLYFRRHDFVEIEMNKYKSQIILINND